VPPSPDETVVSASEDIVPTCPCEDPTTGTGTAAEVAYTTLVDQHMIPLEGMEDRMLNLLPWVELPPVRHMGRPKDVHVALLLGLVTSSVVFCLFPTLEGTLDAFLLTDFSKLLPDEYTCSIGDQKLA
jgi:hypothetical protein